MSGTALVAPELLVFDLSHTCYCYGCCRKISKVINRFEGVCEHWFEENRLIVKGMNVDPCNVIRLLSKMKKRVEFLGTSLEHHPVQHYPIHAWCTTNEPCHCPPPHQGHDNIHFDEPPPPFSTRHCPPTAQQNVHGPPHCNNELPCTHATSNAPPVQDENFMHGADSPLIPSDVSNAGLLGQLANVKNLKQVDLVKKKGIKFTFEDGRVTSCHPTSSMELRPGYDCNASPPPPHHLPPGSASPFRDEYPNSFCSIM